MLKGNFLKQFYVELWFVKKCQNCTFKVNFLCQKSTELKKKICMKEYQFRRPFFVTSKGQSISKCFCGVSISSKKRTKTVQFPPKNDFRSFFEEIKDSKKPFQN